MNKFRLVKFNEQDDYNFVYELKKLAYKKYVEKFFGAWNEQQQLDMYKAFLEERKNNIKIIIIDNKKAGFIDGKIIDEITYEQGNICLAPEFQGQGIGTKLLQNIFKTYRNKNIKLRVFKTNPAKKLYERLGFITCDETTAHYVMLKKQI